VLTSNAHTVAVSIGPESKRGRKKDEAEQTTCVALATLVQLSNRHFRYLNSLRAGNICLFCCPSHVAPGLQQAAADRFDDAVVPKPTIENEELADTLR